jgi:hypothetical protein
MRRPARRADRERLGDRHPAAPRCVTRERC